MEEQVLSFDANAILQLLKDFDTITTFPAVNAWDARAQTEIDRLLNFIQRVDIEHGRQTQALQQLEREHSERSFLERLFASQKEEKQIAQRLAEYAEVKSKLTEWVNLLQESVDFTPNTSEEQALLLKELYLKKKELQVQKREVVATMRAVRTQARQESANAGIFLGGVVYNRKMAAVERRNIRYSKEAALRPHEDATAAIERQILQLERDILRVEKIKADPIQEPAEQ